ncbi:MAG: hypothetical protein LUC99_06770 [Clostridiales bacterium]|nr:hypothetical protein [Bacteroides thetaiotaomicron]MCD8224532.1 hypothetical protein [Clostridiales bacterium]
MSIEPEERTVLDARIRHLEEENHRLNDVVDWMHKTIWDLLAQNRDLKRQLEEAAAREKR